ncbi:OLC1v1015921C1 [Oldenlandia corymbosa var. corymbosa]|uniref:OLC1v1015921C1 n=1 Tax=Oldenlandia corymbosa var. corymbosa TaxID=529605 RepID=A0AAV1E6H1_OLDCO|nr:OLC1v1015921C1 [Oldenlandia corymbosa var. corymbosa]
MQLRFHVPPIAEKKILSSIIGHKWKNWKSALKAKYWSPGPVEYLVDYRDKRVLLDQWVKILGHWNLENAKANEIGHPPNNVQLYAKCYLDPKGNSTTCGAALSTFATRGEHQVQECSEVVISSPNITESTQQRGGPSQVNLGQHLSSSTIVSGNAMANLKDGAYVYLASVDDRNKSWLKVLFIAQTQM